VSAGEPIDVYAHLESLWREWDLQVSKVSRCAEAVPAGPGEVQGTLQRGDKAEALEVKVHRVEGM
jgi:hypothetical protein